MHFSSINQLEKLEAANAVMRILMDSLPCKCPQHSPVTVPGLF